MQRYSMTFAMVLVMVLGMGCVTTRHTPMPDTSMGQAQAVNTLGDEALADCCVDPTTVATPQSATPAKTPVSAAQATDMPFARVYLSLKGCTSCAACRASIRQMAAGQAEGGEAALDGDQLEIRYPTPAQIPLRSVIEKIATNRLHDLDLVDVLFEARGTLRDGAAGGKEFVLAETGQSFPVTLGSLTLPEKGNGTLVLSARVTGWRKISETLALEATGVKSA